MLIVLAVGPQVLVQDRGRFGYAHLGVPRAGALDAPAAALANRLVGNAPDAAVLEVLLGGLTVRAEEACWVALTGADTRPALARSTGTVRRVPQDQAVRLRAGATLTLGMPASGMRTYLAVAGGIAVAPVLGSRATDTLAGVGPAPVAAGDRLPVGPPLDAPAALDTPRHPVAEGVRVLAGPHAEWFEPDVVGRLAATRWTVAAASDRVGLRLAGAPLGRAGEELAGEELAGEELASEGTVLGAIQVPPDGRPVILLADHGPTGGYPVAGVVHPDDLWQLAQLRPGEPVTLRRPGPSSAARD